MLKSTKAALAFIALTAPALSACEVKPKNVVDRVSIATTICDVVKLPIGSNGLNVTLEAEFISDRKERSLLQDESCPNFVVVPYDGSRTVKDEGYQAFARILNANPLQVGLVKAHVTIYGTLKKIAPNRYRLDVIRYIGADEQTAR